MTPSQPEREAPVETNDKPDDAGMDWAAILASLAKLEAGLHKVDAELGRLHGDLEALAGSEPVNESRDRGAARLRRGAPSVGGVGGHVGAPMFSDEVCAGKCGGRP